MKYALMALMFAVSSFSYANDITVEDGLSVMPKPQKIAEVTDVKIGRASCRERV